MRLVAALLALPLSFAAAKPYSGRVKIADETRLQAEDRGINYGAMLDAAIDGNADALKEFILIIDKLDTSGAYFHFFHLYEVAELAGDKKLQAAIESLPVEKLRLLAEGLAEARGWLKRKKSFAKAFPLSTAALRKKGIRVDF